MNSKDYLILTKGRAVCLVLDTARYVLAEMEFDDEAFETTRKECEADVFNLIIQVATISNGYDDWLKVYAFLNDLGRSVPEELNQEMRYMSSVADILPSEQRHN